MNNNQNNTKTYMYTVNVNSDINYDVGKKQVQEIVKPKILKSDSRPTLTRAMQSLKLVNPFEGV